MQTLLYVLSPLRTLFLVASSLALEKGDKTTLSPPVASCRQGPKALLAVRLAVFAFLSPLVATRTKLGIKMAISGMVATKATKPSCRHLSPLLT